MLGRRDGFAACLIGLRNVPAGRHIDYAGWINECMESSDSISITTTDDTTELTLSEITIGDPDVVEYFSDNQSPAAVRRILRLGVQAARTAETTEDVDYIDRRFQTLEQSFEDELDAFEEQLEATFDDDTGYVPQLLDEHLDALEDSLREHLGEEGEFIRDSLDHEDSPLTDVSDQIVSLRDEVMKDEGGKEQYQKSTEKGLDFEAQLESFLQQQFMGPMDDLTPTGTQTGGTGDSKKGDFVITTDGGHRIAIEAKRRTQQMSKPKIGEDLDQTLQNREADYAIMVMRNVDGVPTTKMGWFHEFDRQRLCVVLSDGPEADVEWRFLAYAYNWARARIAQSQANAAEIDGDVINQELEVIETQINHFESIQNTARTIREDAKDIIDDLDDAERTIMNRLNEVKAELGVDS